MTRRKTHEEYLEELFQKEIKYKPLEPYRNGRTKIFHRCPEGHLWRIRPKNILQGDGCPKCSKTNSAKKGPKKTHEDYLKELFEKEINYEPLEPYVNSYTKILHQCIEGHQWYVKPSNILMGKGCPHCPRCPRRYNSKTHEDYLKELFEKEINYEPLETYINTDTKILHQCIEGHQWYVTPSHILKGRGCPSCATHKYSFNLEKPAILYYLKVDAYYKVGITNRTVNERFHTTKDREKITVLFEKYYERGQDARDQEQAILKEFADYRIHVPGLLRGGGNTELFTEDVLQFDKKGP